MTEGDRSRSIYEGPWRIDVTLRPAAGAPPAPLAVLARSIAAALRAAGAPAPASIGLVLSADAELAALNEAHLGVVGATDVLSFPLLPPEAFPPHAGDPDRGPDVAAADLPRPPGSRLNLGDVVVSVERAIDQASTGRGGQTGDVSWSPADELRLLVVHGALHVCGWDHADPAEQAAMRALEQQVLRLES